MNFGGLGLWEILFLFVIALIVFGPDKLPEIGRTIGRGLRELTRASQQFTQEFNRQLQEEPPQKSDERSGQKSETAKAEDDGQKQ